MFFRFAGSLVLVVAVSLLGIALEKETLIQRRRLTHQNYQLDVLRDRHARLRLDVEKMGSPQQTIHVVDRKSQTMRPTILPSQTALRPVLRWQRQETQTR